MITVRAFWAALLALVALAASVQAQEAKRFHWEALDVELTVRPDGALQVAETHRYVYDAGTFRSGFRAIPLDRIEAIDDVRVVEDGRAYQPGWEQPGRYAVSREDGEVRVIWWHEPTTGPAARTVRLEYLARGVVRIYPGGDQLFWKAVFADRSARVDASTVTVRLPAPVGPDQLVIASYGVRAASAVVDAQTVRFTAGRLDPGEELEVRVQFPHGLVPSNPPRWQAEAEWADQYNTNVRPLLNVGLFLVSLLVLGWGGFALWRVWSLRGRDPSTPEVARRLSEPPSTLPPGLAGTLLDERAEVRDVVATLLDLARRGAVRIEVVGPAERPKDWLLELVDARRATWAFERRLLERLFAGGGSVHLSALKDQFYRELPELERAFYDEAVRQGLFPESPERVRSRYTTWGIGLLLASGPLLALVLLGALEYAELAPAPVIALDLLGIGLIVVGQQMGRKTELGAREATRWRAFRTHLAALERVAPEEAERLLEEHLPYAVALGVEERFLKAFERTPVRGPHWYHYHPVGSADRASDGRSGSDGRSPSGGDPPSLSALNKSLVALLNSASTTLASSPSSSSSGGFSGGGGGGGGGSGGGSGGAN